ncbi:hypothetical protein HanIR_Chr14g0692171 [Helianthus annuus]|nr:hypothetical protein HanIR_Chr14g0692171 [Helianthus annuus]
MQVTRRTIRIQYRVLFRTRRGFRIELCFVVNIGFVQSALALVFQQLVSERVRVCIIDLGNTYCYPRSRNQYNTLEP